MNITQPYLNQLKPEITERDLAIIEQVGRFKLMRAEQIERLFFAEYDDPRTGYPVAYSDKSRSRGRQAVLRRLVDNRVLARVGERRVGGASRGSANYIYALDVAGQHLAGLTGRPRRPHNEYEPSHPHLLAVAELYVRLVEAQRQGLLTLLAFEAEPYCWRTFGQRTLKPDAFVQIGIEHEGVRRKGSFFIEVDRGSQWGTKISTKLPQYLDYWRQEQQQATAEPRPAFPAIAFLAPNPRRLAHLDELINTVDANLRPLFRAGLFDDALRVLIG